MVFFNYALRKLNAKIVYYGPGLCGKTTNLVWIHDHFEGGDRGKMISLATEGDRTIFFDLLPLEIGAIRGMDVTLQLYTVPGQVHYNSTRQLVLRGADGVVFVADSQRAMQASNSDSFKNLQENLLLQGISLDGFPHVLQFNKRDLRDVVPVEELNDQLNHYSVPIFEATAVEGVGVQETLEGIVKLVMRNLRQRYEGATTGARTPGVEDSQVKIPEAPPTPPPGPVEVPPPEAPAEPISVSEAPPVEPTAPPAPKPAVGPKPPPVKPVVPPEPKAPVKPPEKAPPTAFVEGDPAETVDFSKAMGSDPFGGLGGGFEDEVSTAVYDVNDDSAIDFEELKRLDAQKSPPVPPPRSEPPPAEPPDYSTGSPGFEGVPPAAPKEAPASFDLDSTDAGLKTQEARKAETHDSMAAFDFNAPPPDMDSIPDFELDIEEPEPKPEGKPPEIEVEAAPQQAEIEPPPVPEPPAAVDLPPAVADFPPAAAKAPPTSAPPRTPAEGMYIDRIEAPSPFAPKPEAQGGPDRMREALGAIADQPPVIMPEETEVPIGEPPPVTDVEQELEAPPIYDVDADFEAPPIYDAEADFEAPPVVIDDEGFDYTPDAAEDEIIDVSAEAAIDEELFEATPIEPVMVGSEEPWTEEELSGVYDLAEVERAERAAAIEASQPRAVDVRAEDNQLHLRLQGTGAIIESGQVRALDIEVPVPGAWVGNRRVTLQLRLTLTPDTEYEDDGPGSPS
jgi:signal recognition particle receptor subunit beta